MINNICNMNCYCPNPKCNLKHYFPFSDRIIIIKILSSLNLQQEKIDYKKKSNCIYGIFCRNHNCKYYHLYNIQGRRKIVDSYYNKSF